MPVIKQHFAVSDARLASALPWRRMLRIDTLGGDTTIVIQALQQLQPERLVYAEGDSWFDKFTPLPTKGTNLLEEIKTPFLTAVVDVAHIGDEVRSMASGSQARQTRAMFDLFDFDAIVLSAGGNDLKNLFVERFDRKARAQRGAVDAALASDIERLSTPASYTEFFAEVMFNIQRFVRLRDTAGRETTRKAPVFVHGYDFLQPRPAGATIFAGTRIGRGPWLYPSMKEAGLSDVQMRSVADAVVDEMNRQLEQSIAALDNVFVIDQRGLLVPAAAGSDGSDADWMDEIHPNRDGFATLARNRWDVPLSRALGWQPAPGDLTDAQPALNRSTALGAAGPVHA